MNKTHEHIALVGRYLADTYNRLPVVLSYGSGAHVWDVEGNEYIDMLSSYSAVSAGHCHPRLQMVLRQQLKRLDLVSNAFYHDQLGPFAKELAEFCGKDRIYPMNTGVEGWEKAIKIIRKWAYTVKGIPRNKAEIIVARGNFHGRTISAISASTEPSYRNYFGPWTPGFKPIPFASLQSLERAIKSHTAAFIVEPIQSEGGINIPWVGYLKEVKKICRDHDVLFVLDEIQTGLGRTGKHFAWQWEDAEPDLIILGKFLGGGIYPVSLVAGNNSIIDVFDIGDDGSTFSANPLACAEAREAINVLVDECLTENSAEQGPYFLDGLKKIRSPFIKEARGKGLLIGIELQPCAGGARRFCEMLLREGLLCKETHINVVRLTPPLIIKRNEIDWALDKIEKVFKEVG